MPTVSSIAALKAALAVNSNTDIEVTNGTYVVASAAQQAATSLWIGAAYAARTNPVLVHAQTPGGVIFSGGGASSWQGIAFEEGAHHQTWEGFSFGNGIPTETGVIMFGGYNVVAPHHITLRTIRMLPTIGDSNPVGDNDHCMYFSHAQGPGPNNILIDGYEVDGSGGVDTAWTMYHSEFGLVNAQDVIMRNVHVVNIANGGQIWDDTINRFTLEDALFENVQFVGVQYEYGNTITLRRVRTVNTGGPGFYSGTSSTPIYVECRYDAPTQELVLTVPVPPPSRTGTANSKWGWTPTASGILVPGKTGTASSQWGWSTAAVAKSSYSGTSNNTKFGFSTAATGTVGTAANRVGTAASSFGWSDAASGVNARSITGTAAASKGWSTSATGVASGPPGVSGPAASKWGFSTAGTGTVGTVSKTGTAASSFGWADAAVGSVTGGVAGVSGPAASEFGWETDAVGTADPLAITGTCGAEWGWSTDADGSVTGAPGVGATSAVEFGWGHDAVGTHGTPAITGASAPAFDWLTAAVGQTSAPRFGGSNIEFDWQTQATGLVALSTGGAAGSAFRWSTQALGLQSAVVTGTAASQFGWSSGSTSAYGETGLGEDDYRTNRRNKKRMFPDEPWERFPGRGRSRS